MSGKVGESGLVVFGVIKMNDIVGCSSVDRGGGSHLARNRLTLNAALAAPPCPTPPPSLPPYHTPSLHKQD